MPKINKSDSDTLAFAKAINNLTETQEEFKKALEILDSLKADTLRDIQLELKAKRDELDRLDKEFQIKKKDLEIQVEQELKEFGYEKALELIGENNEVAVEEDEYNSLVESVDTLKEELQAELTKKVQEAQAEGKKALNAAISTNNLVHKAEVATLTAQVEQLTKERKMYETTISNLQADITAQRELTRQVAEASKSGAISQSFGK